MIKTLTSLAAVLTFVSGIVAVILTFFSLGFASPVPWFIVLVVIAIPFIYKKYADIKAISWDPSYSVGVAAMDDDHKRLIILINQLESAANYYTNKEFEEKALMEVVDYTKYHFEHEEQLMKDNSYPGYEEHIKQHIEMIIKINNIVEEYKNKPDYAINKAVKFLRCWLINHILKTDQEYTEFFHEKGIS
jgi:hemerythrin